MNLVRFYAVYTYDSIHIFPHQEIHRAGSTNAKGGAKGGGGGGAKGGGGKAKGAKAGKSTLKTPKLPPLPCCRVSEAALVVVT